MAGAEEVDTEREDYVVSVLEFAGDTASAVRALQRLFALSEPDARSMLREAPVAVRRGVNRIRAEYFRRALELAGVRVEVRDGQGELVRAQMAAEPRSAQRPAPQTQAAAAPPRPVASSFSAAPDAGSPLTAAAPVIRESARATPFGDTLVMGGMAPKPREALPANDTDVQPGWGELQRPSAERAATVPAGPGPSSSQLEADLARSFEQPPWASAAASPQGPREPDGGHDLSLQHGAPSDDANSPLELDVSLRRRESAPRYEPIPLGEQWKAPGSETIARAQRKQQVHALESGMGDLRPSPRPPGMPAPRATRSERPAARIQETTRQPAPKVRTATTESELGFWQVTSLPFSGSGWTRILLITGGGVGLGLIAKVTEGFPWLGAPLLLLGLSPLLAICVEYQRSVFWATATGDRELESSAALPVPEMIRNGLFPLGLAAMTHVLVWIWLISQILAQRTSLSIVSSPALWVLGFGPGFYWPIALGCAAARNHIRGVWDIAQGLRALGRAPVPIAQAALASGCTFAISLLVSTALLGGFGLGPTFTLVAASGPALALSHGLMGAWLGRTLRARPDLFE
jgi:hypothetical protein